MLVGQKTEIPRVVTLYFTYPPQVCDGNIVFRLNGDKDAEKIPFKKDIFACRSSGFPQGAGVPTTLLEFVLFLL